MRWILFLLVISFNGCMTAEKSVRIKNDNFSDKIKIIGMEVVKEKQTLVNVERERYYLRSWVNKETKEVKHQLYYSIDYNDSEWRSFHRAALKGGDQLEFDRISTDVKVGGSTTHYYETIGAMIPHEYLISNKEGFPVKWYAQNGTTKVTYLKPQQIKKQLKALQEQRSRLTSNN